MSSSPFSTKSVQKLLSAFPDAKHTIRFVGGCVRDDLVNRPFQDIDLCTQYTPSEVIALLEKAGIKFVPTGIQHGTVMAVVDGTSFEITTLREDIQTDGRHAVVKFTDSFEVDAKRRDFTINALSRDCEGRLYDYCGGLEDLETGTIRFIGSPEKRIEEDYLRLLRFFRFYARYGQQLPDPKTIIAIKTNVPNLVQISGERIQNEFTQLLSIQILQETIMMMEDVGLFPYCLDTDISLNLLKKLFHYEITHGSSVNIDSRWVALLEADETKIKTASKRLKFSKKRYKSLITITEMAHTFEDEPLACHLYKKGPAFTKSAYELFCLLNNRDCDDSVFTHIKSFVHKDFPLTGQDLQEEGFLPGKKMGQELKKREKAWVLDTFSMHK